MTSRQIVADAKRRGATFTRRGDRLTVKGLARLPRRLQTAIRASRPGILKLLPDSQEPVTLVQQQQALVDRALVAEGLPPGAIRVGHQCQLTFEMTGGLADETLRDVAYSVAPILAAIPDVQDLPPGGKLPHGNIKIWR